MTDANLARLIEDGVTTVRLSYPDLHGIARGKEYPVAFFDHLVADGAAHCEAIMTVDLAHNVISTRRRSRGSRGTPTWRGASPISSGWAANRSAATRGRC
jgi:glutamine synthetase